MNPHPPSSPRSSLAAPSALILAAMTACAGAPSSVDPEASAAVPVDGSASDGEEVTVIHGAGPDAGADATPSEAIDDAQTTTIPGDAGMPADDGAPASDSASPPAVDASSDAPLEAGLQCTSAQLLCGGVCVDSSTSPNCGTCGNTCSVGETCLSGVCGCPAGETQCGGTCVAEADDPNNCGACGHGCLGGACSNGQCQAVGLTTFLQAMSAIVLDSDNVYFSTGQGLYTCPKAGCESPTQLTEIGAVALLYDPRWGSLFATETNGKTLDEDTTLGLLDYAAVFPGASGLAMNVHSVYVGVGDGIVGATRGPSAFESPQYITGGVTGGVNSVAADAEGNFIYGTASDSSSIILTTSANLGKFTTFATNQPFASSIAVGGENVYWISEVDNQWTPEPFSDEEGAAYMCPVGDSCATPTRLGGGHFCSSLIVDTTDVYFACDDTVYRCPLTGCAGGQLSVLWSGDVPGASIALATDATAIYWNGTFSTPPYESLFKLAK